MTREEITKIKNKKVRVEYTCEICGKSDIKIASFLLKEGFLCKSCKTKKTNLEKYGVDNPAKRKDILEKTAATNLKKYGTKAPGQSALIKAKVEKTIKEKYGDWKNRPCYQKEHERFINQRNVQSEENELVWLDKENFHGKYDNGPIYYHFKCKKCDLTFEDSFHDSMPQCPKCNQKSGVSNQEIEISNYIKSIYKGKIIEHDRAFLDGKELDIYLPDLKLAFEYNGNYWHGYRKDSTESISDFKKKVEFKRLACQDKGVRLINIDECDYVDRPEVFKRFIDDLILPRKRVYARKCEIKPIDTRTAKDFCEYYHVNGFKGGSIKLGLYNNNELLVVAIFAKHKKYDNECIRLCYKTGIDVIGGWEKVQKHFGKKFLHYVNLKYFTGENKTGCGYRFYLHKKVYYRNVLQKKNLHKYLDKINPELSDFQNCLMNNGIAIFDVGNDIRIYNEVARKMPHL